MKGNTRLEGRAYLAIGLMLFALFFGAGNLIFPAAMGQNAGYNVWWAVAGFLVTGIGLPLLSVIALGYSGCKNIKVLASRVHPWYGIFFSCLLYLTIGPAFAIPRTGTVSYEIAIRPFLASGGDKMSMVLVLVLFFLVSWWLAVTPQKLVDRIGKVLTPLLLFSILVLIIKSFITPLGGYLTPTSAYATSTLAFTQGFLDGYNTMDVIAALAFGVLVIDFVSLSGAQTKGEIASATLKAGLIAVICLGLVYVFIGHLGATSVEKLGILNTGAPVLAESARILFGQLGAVILAIIVLLACLTTSVGLITACASFFSQAIGGFSYKMYVALFSLISFFVGTFGLETIIVAAIPVLMFLYPLAIVIVFLSFLHDLFKGRQCVYAWCIGLTFIIALISGLETANVNLGSLGQLVSTYVPLHASGMGWLTFAIIGFIIGLIWSKVFVAKTPEFENFE